MSGLLDLVSARTGHFRLESGYHGDLWLDLDEMLVEVSRTRPFALELARRLSAHKPIALCGPLVGGAFIAQTIASELGLEFYYAQRVVPQHRDGLFPVEYQIPASLRERVRGKDIALVDDATNAGSAVRGTLASLEACGARVVVVGALLVLGSQTSQSFADQGIPLESLASLASGLWTPSECPLCASHIPLEDNSAL